MATWHNHVFCLKLSVIDSPLDIKDPRDKNRFRFQEFLDASGDIYQYALQPLNPRDMNDAWSKFTKLLPQPGAQLNWALADDDKLDPEDPDYDQKLQALVETIEEQKINDPAATYERLVGTFAAEDADNPITFYRVSHVFKNHDQKLLLIVQANFINGGAPVGVLAADN